MPDHGPQPDLPVGHDDLAVTLAVRGELGPGSDDAVIAEFLDRVGTAIDQRVDQRVADRAGGKVAERGARHTRSGPQLGFFSLVFGIPITAIAANQGMGPMVVAWAGIAAVNLADALRR